MRIVTAHQKKDDSFGFHAFEVKLQPMLVSSQACATIQDAIFIDYIAAYAVVNLGYMGGR